MFTISTLIVCFNAVFIFNVDLHISMGGLYISLSVSLRSLL